MKALFKTSHYTDDIKSNPILTEKALIAMRDMNPDKSGLKRFYRSLKRYNDWLERRNNT